MAANAWVDAQMRCPGCDAVVADLHRLSWGGVLSADVRDGPVYRIGSGLLWFVDDQGIVPADTSWSPPRCGANLGDPRIADVDVPTEDPSRCLVCGLELHGAVIAIRRGVIAGIRAAAPGEALPHVNAIVIDPATGEPVEELLSDQTLRKRTV